MSHEIPFDARRSKCGKYAFLPRRDLIDEAILDRQFGRRNPGELCWELVERADYIHVLDAAPEGDVGLQATIFGKGPSLDRYLELPREDRRTDPRGIVVALNEAALLVSPDYLVCLDLPTLTKRIGRQAVTSALITRLAHADAAAELGYEPLTFSRGDLLGVTGADSSGSVALRVLAAWGVTDVMMVGFDGWDTGDGFYAERLRGKTVRPSVDNLDNANQAMARAIEDTGIMATWWHRPPTETGAGEPISADAGDSAPGPADA